ncbi:HMG box-containing protein 4-like [Periophthalmus magnuspinnatus]|uniref:HMG box-containing protein 4-like n=1 Tax=Periophthalmus magnuspinnatus TaxID=409849 RepID=UPI0024371F72|nr:HMG box-containing protein 4-like [Periophthalmus magnuspinnatus]
MEKKRRVCVERDTRGEFCDSDLVLDSSLKTRAEQRDVPLLDTALTCSVSRAALVWSELDGRSALVSSHEPLPALEVSVCPCSSLPGLCDHAPVTAAAHLHLLGEALSLIGLYLQDTDRRVSVSTALSVLLDSLLCTLAPLVSLSSQVPELQGCVQHSVDLTLENVSYLMPGL